MTQQAAAVGFAPRKPESQTMRIAAAVCGACVRRQRTHTVALHSLPAQASCIFLGHFVRCALSCGVACACRDWCNNLSKQDPALVPHGLLDTAAMQALIHDLPLRSADDGSGPDDMYLRVLQAGLFSAHAPCTPAHAGTGTGGCAEFK